MKKVLSTIKPFTWGILLSIALLFVQAYSELELPTYMSDIVNIGIQQNGIQNTSPTEMSEDAYELFSGILPSEKASFFEESYEKEGNVYYLKEGVDREELDTVVTRGILSVMELAKENGDGNTSDTTELATDFDIKQLYEITPMLQMIPNEKKVELYDQVSNSDSMFSDQIGIVFARMLYEEVGVDIDAMQSSYIWKTGFLMLGYTFLGMAAALGVAYLGSKIAAGYSRDLRLKVFKKVESFSSEEFDKFSSSSLVVRTTNDITQVQQLVNMGIRMFFYAPIIGIGGVLMMLREGYELAWIIVVVVIALLLLMGIVFIVAVPKFKIMQDYIDNLNLVYRENLNGVMVIRAFGNHEFENDRFDKANKDTVDLSRFTNRVMSFMMPMMMFLMNITMLAIIWFGARLVSDGVIQIGSMMAFMQYAMQVIMAFLMISMMFIFIPRALVSINRIAAVLDTENIILDPKNPQQFIEDKTGYVEFENVTFKYGDADEAVLEDISFIAKPGQTTAFIGSTGSGKSTLINLVPRFFDATSGSIKVNGRDVQDVTQFDLHKSIGYVPQKGMLLSGTVASNLRYGNKEATNEDLIRALEISQSTFVLEKEDGLEMPISQGGANVSGGQKQRLSIARAIATNAPIFIFDDSFSALDFKTDRSLRDAIHENLADATLLIVAQRVNTIMDADQIIVMDKGKVVGKGTHAQLLKECETYYEIAASQLTEEELQNV